jgi:predicted DNA-binding transcriptional regulator AlpA
MFSGRRGRSGTSSAGRTHLCGMETTAQRQTRTHASSDQQGLDPVVTLSELASQLGVSVQTLCDLRSQGRGPRGFRVGRELRFRVGEVNAWLARLEAGDAERHPQGRGDAQRSTSYPDRARTARSTPDVTVVASWRRPGFATSTGASARSRRPGRPRPPREPGSWRDGPMRPVQGGCSRGSGD